MKIRPYEFSTGIPQNGARTFIIRMLPNLRKDGSIGPNFKEVKFLLIKVDDGITKEKWEKFYTEDAGLNLAVSQITPRKLRDGGIMKQNKVVFYGIIDGKVEMISTSSRIFNEIQTSLIKEIGNGKSPLDPTSGVGIEITADLKSHASFPEINAKVVTDLDPISIGDTNKECRDFILNREVDMDEYLDQYLIDKHENKNVIYNFLLNNEDLSEWKSSFREKRLKDFLNRNRNKKTDK
ncbi:MAG: hypothetical protein SLAVMIC_00153 [uncultured marine phage]|uniref:Uncharacterized protein n=1 Tax=uncultured marine phage TaxID=707152 RepID=A0A8D9C8F7_9VIRU|nr:MAG: hypothetical protein SLAVMIC_00153 [uncultured marine phage]